MSIMQSINAVLTTATTSITTAANALNVSVEATGTIAEDWAAARKASRKARLLDSLEELEVEFVENKVKRERKLSKLSESFEGDFDSIRTEIRKGFEF